MDGGKIKESPGHELEFRKAECQLRVLSVKDGCQDELLAIKIQNPYKKARPRGGGGGGGVAAVGGHNGETVLAITPWLGNRKALNS